MRGDCTSGSTVHYESCLNSTCSRSPSPVRRLLWEPKYLPPCRIRDHHNKNESSLKALGISKAKLKNKGKDSSSFHCRQDDGAEDNDSRCNPDPFIRYTFTEHDDNNRGTGSKNFLVTIQQNVPQSSPPSPRNKTPEPGQPRAQHQDRPAGNLTLQLELDASKNPPTINISSKNSVISEAAPHVALSAIPSAASSTCTPCCHPCFPSTNTSACQAFPYVCVGQAATQSEPSCDAPFCLPCPGPYVASPKSTADKATSPITGYGSPKTIQPQGFPPCQSSHENCCPCHTSFIPSNQQDRATSPIKGNSRPSSPTARVSFNPTPAHSRSNSASSQGSLEIESNEGVFSLDWNGPIGPVDVEVPIAHNSRINIKEDHIDSHDPELEVFYPSSCAQSQGKSSPLSPTCPTPEWLRLRPAWNPCSRRSDCCPSEKHSSSPTPWKSRSQSITPSRTPISSSPITRDLNGRYHSTIEEQPRSTFSWRNRSNDGMSNRCSTPQLLICPQVRCQSQLSRSYDSPRVILTPRPAGCGRGEVTVQWENPSHCLDTTCGDCTPCCTYEHEHKHYEHCGLPYNDVLEVEEDEGSEEYDAGQIIIPQEFEVAEPRNVREDISKPIHPSKTLVHDYCTSSLEPKCTGCCPLQSNHSTMCCPSTCGAALCACIGVNPPYPWRPPNCNLCCVPQSSSNCFDNCPYCCSGKYNCRADLNPPVDGENQCTSLPPHLQSDWSASLRCPPNQMKTKPVLYKDDAGHEHIMFGDGSVEHLSHPCKPAPLALASQCSLPLPPLHMSSPTPIHDQGCFYYCDGDGDGGDGDGGHFGSPPKHIQECIISGPPCQEAQINLSEKHKQQHMDFSPRSGDIVIRATCRMPCLEPGKDDGKVAFYTSTFLDLRERDSIVRLGKFDALGKWCSSQVVEMYMRGNYGTWLFLGKHIGHECLHPLQPDQHQKVRTPSNNFQPRQGDLVISTIPRPNSFYFWNLKHDNFECHPGQLLLRAFIGRPRVVDSNHNFSCCVNEHLPVGYAELYCKVNSSWLFLGRDDHMFSEHELLHFS